MNLNIIILMVSPYQNSKLKIQMVAGNCLNVCPDSDSQKKLPLEKTLALLINEANIERTYYTHMLL